MNGVRWTHIRETFQKWVEHFLQIDRKMDSFWIGANFVAYSSNVCYKHKIAFPNNGKSQNFTKYWIFRYTCMKLFPFQFFGLFCVSFRYSICAHSYDAHICRDWLHWQFWKENTKFIKKNCFSCRIYNDYGQKRTFCATAIVWNWNPDERTRKNVFEV